MSQRPITVLWSWNCEMDESRFGANTSRKDRRHLSGFSILRIKDGGGRSKITRNIVNEAGYLTAALSLLLGLTTKRDDRRSLAGPIHRRPIAECGGFVAPVPDLTQFVIP